jgi:hypothetical protein
VPFPARRLQVSMVKGVPMSDGDDPLDDAAAAALAVGQEVLHPHDAAIEAGVRRQMQTMFTRDRLMAVAFVVLLLIAVPFVLVAVWDSVPTTGIKVVLVVSGVVVLIYNVASMVAMVGHFRADLDFVYRRDVANLREREAMRAAEADR